MCKKAKKKDALHTTADIIASKHTRSTALDAMAEEKVLPLACALEDKCGKKLWVLCGHAEIDI